MSAAQQIVEGLLIFGELLIVIVKMIIFSIENFYYKIFPKKEVSVKGEIVLITGTGHGIGKELALQYAALGATVVGCDVNVKDNDATIKEINERGCAKAYGYYCDVSSCESVNEMAEKIQKEVGDVTILINNAGIMISKPFLDHTPVQIERTLGINVLAHFWTIKAFLPAMLKKNHGHVVALCSCAGTVGVDNCGAYSTSKFAVRGMMEVLFNELRTQHKSKVRCTSVFPSFVDTGMCKKPRIRFNNTMKILEPKHVASKIISAQRRRIFEISLPEYVLNFNTFLRLLPLKATLTFTDFIDSGVDLP